MNGRCLMFVLCAIGAVRICGQSVQPVKVAASPSTNTQPIAATPREEIVLTGITDLTSYKRAFFQVELPGQPAQYRTLAEGEQKGEIALLTIDSQKAKVMVRYRGAVQELRLNARTSGPPAPPAKELQRDASHSSHHAKRAQLDREHDAVEKHE